MNTSLIRLVATLVLGSQLAPMGLPLLCDQVLRGSPADCEQSMATPHHGPSLGVVSTSTSCANSAFCPTHMTAVPTLNTPVAISNQLSNVVASRIAEFSPVDPQAPLPPPPQA
jgi:hypothetical protein